MSEKLQNINSKSNILANPSTSKVAILFPAAAVDGQKIIVKNGTDKDIFVRGDVDNTVALAFPTTDGAIGSNAEGTHILAGTAEPYELTKGMTQLSVVASAASTGNVSIKVGEGS